MKKNHLYAALMLLVLTLIACPGGGGMVTPTPTSGASLASVRADVLLREGATGTLVPAGDTRSLAVGQAIDVDENGRARLRFLNYLIVEVFRDTDLQLESMAAADAPPAYKFKLEAGTLYAEVDPATEVVSIESDLAVITALGTKFWVYVARGKITWVVCKEGKIQITARGRTVTVAADQQSWVRPGQPPHDPVEAFRDEVGGLVPLVDELTGGEVRDEQVLQEEGIVRVNTPTPTPRQVQRATNTPTRRATSTPTRRVTPTPTRRATNTPTRRATNTPTPFPTPAVSFWADETRILACKCTTLRWEVAHATAVYLGNEGVTSRDSLKVCPKESRAYTLRAESPGGAVERSVSVQVIQPTVNFRADRTTITSGECTTLRWDVDNADAVEVVYLNGQGVAGHSTQSVCPKTTSTYTLRVVTACSDENYPLTITVSGLPAGTIGGEITWNQQPVGGISVELLLGECNYDKYQTMIAAGDPPPRTVTGNDGTYRFTGQPSGEYALIVNGWWNDQYRNELYGGACYPDYVLPEGRGLTVDFNLHRTNLSITFPKENDKINAKQTTFQWSAYPQADSYGVILIQESPSRETVVWDERTTQPQYTVKQDLTYGARYWLLIWAYRGNLQIANGQIRFETLSMLY